MKKDIFLFLKDNRTGIFFYFLQLIILTFTLFMYNVSFEIISYVVFLSGILALIFAIFSFFRNRKQRHFLADHLFSDFVETTGFLKPRNSMEKCYQELLQSTSHRIKELKSEEIINRQEQEDYYSMWVHQIKTPIAAMHLLHQTLDEQYPGDATLRELKMNLFKIEQYVEMVLSYLRAKDLSSDMHFETCSLDDILKRALKKYSQMFILQRIRLNYTPTDLLILTDKKWLSFVLEQILSNALKYTPSGGCISIFLDRGTRGSYLVIEDTGIGIAPEDLPRIFEKGFTGYNGRANKKSTGIGLYLCKTILDRLNHTIWIDSKIGEGTRISFDLLREIPTNYD